MTAATLFPAEILVLETPDLSRDERAVLRLLERGFLVDWIGFMRNPAGDHVVSNSAMNEDEEAFEDTRRVRACLGLCSRGLAVLDVSERFAINWTFRAREVLPDVQL